MNKYRIVEKDLCWRGEFLRKVYVVEKYTFLKNGFHLMDWVQITTDFWHKEEAENWLNKKLCEEQIDDMRLAKREAEQAKHPKEPPKRVVHRYTAESDSILEPWGVGKITSRLDERTGSADR
jgi:hypothetical protein